MKKPDGWVTTDLYEALVDTLNVRIRKNTGRMFVYCGPSRNGKTVAAKALICHVKGVLISKDILRYPSLYIDVSGGKLDAAIRAKLSVPELMTNDEWSYILFNFISNAISLGSESSKAARYQRISCFEDNTTTEFQNSDGCALPIMVLDDVNHLDEDDAVLLRKIYKYSSDHRVLVFVLTDDEGIANFVAAMNNKERVRPLAGRFTLHPGQTDYDVADVKDDFYHGSKPAIGKTAIGITWIPEAWPRFKQQEHLRQFFAEKEITENLGADGCFTFLVDGECPQKAFERASEYFSSDSDIFLKLSYTGAGQRDQYLHPCIELEAFALFRRMSNFNLCTCYTLNVILKVRSAPE